MIQQLIQSFHILAKAVEGFLNSCLKKSYILRFLLAIVYSLIVFLNLYVFKGTMHINEHFHTAPMYIPKLAGRLHQIWAGQSRVH